MEWQKWRAYSLYQYEDYDYDYDDAYYAEDEDRRLKKDAAVAENAAVPDEESNEVYHDSLAFYAPDFYGPVDGDRKLNNAEDDDYSESVSGDEDDYSESNEDDYYDDEYSDEEDDEYSDEEDEDYDVDDMYDGSESSEE